MRGKLSEPSEIQLGVGKKARRGRGIGRAQEQQIVTALTESEAARLGVIHAIEELELHIDGIGPDKISDLVANIILDRLASYTETTCAEYGIATRPCAVSGFWNADRKEWDGAYFNLPVRGNDSYILVPKRFVRRQRDLMNHNDFYNRFVLDVIEHELINAGDSLVRTLQSGERRVTKKDMREDSRFTPTKEFISRFIVTHPEIMEDYRQELKRSFNPTDPAIWSEKSELDDPQVEELVKRLDGLSSGRADANAYHQTVLELVKFVFDWALENFASEYKMDGGRGRLDIISDNTASGGVFAEVRTAYSARTVPMECKNYGTDLGNEEFNQLNDRLGDKTSRLGILFCRTIDDRQAMRRHQTDRYLRHNNLMLLIDDHLLKRLIIHRLQRDYTAIETVVRSLLRDVQYGNPPEGNDV